MQRQIQPQIAAHQFHCFRIGVWPGGQSRRIAGNLGRMTDAFEPLLNAAQVPHLIIDDGNGYILSSEILGMKSANA